MIRLSPEERDAFGVDVVDDLGAAMLTAVAGYGRDVPFMMVTSVWIDETGTGGDPRLMVGGIIAGAMKWLGFSQQWSLVLQTAGVPHAHLYKMERNEGPFVNRDIWGVSRKAEFFKIQFDILKKWCQLGLTVSLDMQLYHDVYRKDFPSGASPDSPYGLACKELILATQAHCERFLEDAGIINFVIEEGHPNLPNVQQIFRELKTCFPEETENLGTLFPMSRDNGLPLQAIDQLVVSARRVEPQMIARNGFIHYTEEDSVPDMLAKLPEGNTFPIFYHDLTEERLLQHREQKLETCRILRRRKRQAKAANRALRGQPS